MGLCHVGGKMKIGEQDLVSRQLRPLTRLRLLHLHDHLGRGKHLGSAAGNLRPGGLVGGIIRANAGTGAVSMTR